MSLLMGWCFRDALPDIGKEHGPHGADFSGESCVVNLSDRILKSNAPSKPMKATEKVARYAKDHRRTYPETTTVLLVSVLAGSSNAQPERFFSRVNWITQKRRNRMGHDLINDTVTIQELSVISDHCSGAMVNTMIGDVTY